MRSGRKLGAAVGCSRLGDRRRVWRHATKDRRLAQLVVASSWSSPVPGVIVKFESGNCITVESSLVAVGTSLNHITYTLVNDNSVAQGNSANWRP